MSDTGLIHYYSFLVAAHYFSVQQLSRYTLYSRQKRREMPLLSGLNDSGLYFHTNF
jgi:hypothetical protein